MSNYGTYMTQYLRQEKRKVERDRGASDAKQETQPGENDE